MYYPLHRPIIKVYMTHLHTLRKRFRVHRKAVILRRYIYPSRGQFLDWVVSAVMPKLEFVGLSTEGPCQELVPQAYTHYGHFAN